MSDDGNMIEDDENYTYEYEEDCDEDEQRTDGDDNNSAYSYNDNEYVYEADMKDSADIPDLSETKLRLPQVLEAIPDGTYVLKEYSEILPIMENLVHTLSTLLNVDDDSSELLLQKYRWSRERLMDVFFSDGDNVMAKTGLDLYDSDIIQDRIKIIEHQLAARSIISTASSATDISSANPKDVFTCHICGDQLLYIEGFALGCNHWFCQSCYSQYLSSQVGDGPICIRAKCPEFKCTQAVPRAAFRALLDRETYSKYRMYITRNFIETSKNMKYCPAANCTMVAIGSGVTRIHCSCSNPFCFRCGEEAHDPCTCAQLATWYSKCQDESETANWIIANTKKCVNCLTRIEKNQGCNHITCKICKHEFCWICLGNWSEHGSATGGFYKCNKFDAAKSSPTASAADKAKAELDRYLHYYQRYHGHDLSLKFAAEQRAKAEAKMLEQQEMHKASWIDVQFLKQAVEQVIDCRRVLKFTYALGYFLIDEHGKSLFEHHQEMLEKNTERLQEYTEQSLDKMDRTQIVNLTRVTEKFLESMLATDLNENILDDSKLEDEEDGDDATGAIPSTITSSPRQKAMTTTKVSTSPSSLSSSSSSSAPLRSSQRIRSLTAKGR